MSRFSLYRSEGINAAAQPRREHKVLRAVLAALFVSGCAGADVRTEDTRLKSQTIAKPGRVLVHEFASNAPNVPEGSAIHAFNTRRTALPSPNAVRRNTRLGALITKHLIAQLKRRGIPAVAALPGLQPRTGDVVILGDIIMVDRGDPFQRVLIGFGTGAVQLRTLSEAYLVVSDALIPLRASEVEANGGKMPGMAMSLGFGSAANIALSGATAVVSEVGPESVEGAAKHTAAQISQLMVAAYARRGWW